MAKREIGLKKIGKKITVTKPFLPELEEFVPYLEEIWDNQWLTNNGPFHQQFESKLCDFLGVKHISLFCNGTIALLVAIKALELHGEIITTPYSFVATTHAIKWNNIEPVFVDIDATTCNLNPDLLENAITKKTTAILPVHIYGNPCNNEKITQIAKKHNLKVIFDAAHAFGVKQNGESILNFGDLSILSFHATKVFNTFEGGAIISHSSEMKRKIDDLKNFAFHGEDKIVGLGINGKMNELQAAMGLLQLKHFDEIVEKRKAIANLYRENLSQISGIRFFEDFENVQHNYAYFPIFVDEKRRDEVYETLKEHNIFGRRYFYPLISQIDDYKNTVSALPGNLPIAEKISREVICLPIYPGLNKEQVNCIISVVDYG